MIPNTLRIPPFFEKAWMPAWFPSCVIVLRLWWAHCTHCCPFKKSMITRIVASMYLLYHKKLKKERFSQKNSLSLQNSPTTLSLIRKINSKINHRKGLIFSSKYDIVKTVGNFRVWRSFGSALEWGSRGRRFNSCHSDQQKNPQT